MGLKSKRSSKKPEYESASRTHNDTNNTSTGVNPWTTATTFANDNNDTGWGSHGRSSNNNNNQTSSSSSTWETKTATFTNSNKNNTTWPSSSSSTTNNASVTTTTTTSAAASSSPWHNTNNNTATRSFWDTAASREYHISWDKDGNWVYDKLKYNNDNYAFGNTWIVPRESYPAASSHHQTLLGKALFEHGDYPTLSAVATSSSSIRNSSLGPNLLSLISLNDRGATFFIEIFLDVPGGHYASTLQFTRKVDLSHLCCGRHYHRSNYGNLKDEAKFVNRIMFDHRDHHRHESGEGEPEQEQEQLSPRCYFLRSLQEVKTFHPCWIKFPAPALTTVHVAYHYQAKYPIDACLLNLLGSSTSDSPCKLPSLTSLEISTGLLTDKGLINIANSPIAKNLKTFVVDVQSNGITAEGVRAFCESAININKLQICTFHFNEECIDVVSQHLLQLEHFDLRQSSAIGDEAMKIFTENAQKYGSMLNLKIMNLVHCHKITEVGVQYLIDAAECFPKMRKIDLTYCDGFSLEVRERLQDAFPGLVIIDDALPEYR